MKKKTKKELGCEYVLHIKITDGCLSNARKRAQKIGANSKKIAKGGELHGILGEQLFLDNYGGTLVDCHNYDIDHPKIGKIDVKTKRCSSPPEAHYACSVAAYQINKEECEFYAFYRIHNNLNDGWFLGIISQKEFMEKAIFLRKGDMDGAFMVKADCYNIPISKLRQIGDVLSPKEKN